MIDNREYVIRMATLDDVEFISQVIIEAEKSMTDHLGLANLFEMSEKEVQKHIVKILEEEVDGCEFSLSSFLVAFYKDEPVSAFGGWLEGYYDDMPSSLLKSNLISFVFPRDNVLATVDKANIVKPLQITRENGTYQLEYGYTKEQHRGHNLIGSIIEEHVRMAKQLNAKTNRMQVHVFANNDAAIAAYRKHGFKVKQSFVSADPQTLLYYPSNTELLMEKEI